MPPIINSKVNLSCNPTTEKTVENIGTKNRKLLATVAPPLRKLKNQSPNEPIEAGKISQIKHHQPIVFKSVKW